MFNSQAEGAACAALVNDWQPQDAGVKRAFMVLKDALDKPGQVMLEFKVRPGVSYSLRAYRKDVNSKVPALFTLLDVVDDDPQERWLSICFFEESITDPAGLGDAIPGGLLGEDGYCFDLMDFHQSLLDYLVQRIVEAYSGAGRGAGD